jgi:hypothetical protein
MKKNINPLVAVAALLVVGGVIYAVFNALTQTGTTTNPALSNRVPDYARGRGMERAPTGGNLPPRARGNATGGAAAPGPAGARPPAGPGTATPGAETPRAGTAGGGAPAGR